MRATAGQGRGCVPTIKIELNYAPLRRPPLMLPVSSFVAEATQRQPEVAQLACVSIVETAAEKLVSLTRRTAMEMAGLSRDPDPALVRHIYDLHMMRDLIDPAEVAALARGIAESDARQFAQPVSRLRGRHRRRDAQGTRCPAHRSFASAPIR